MKLSAFAHFAAFGMKTILFGRKDPIVGTIILTDKCNLHCKHCSVNNITAAVHPISQIRGEMKTLYSMGVRILFFCGGETFLWRDGEKTLRDLVGEAREMGFLIVNVVTNGTFPLDLPEADLILLSLDGDRARHNAIRGDTYDTILANIRQAPTDNICLYMAINQVNQDTIGAVCRTAMEEPNVRAVSFNFHTPYPDTRALALSREKKAACCAQITRMMEAGAPVFNLRSAFPHLIQNTFPTPCRQCVVMEDGRLSMIPWDYNLAFGTFQTADASAAVNDPGLCGECGYFFAAEYSLLFRGNVRVMADMLRTYLKYI